MLCTEQFEEAERLQFTAAKRIMEPVENMNTLLATQCCASQSQAALNVLLRCCFAGVSGPQLSNASFLSAISGATGPLRESPQLASSAVPDSSENRFARPDVVAEVNG